MGKAATFVEAPDVMCRGNRSGGVGRSRTGDGRSPRRPGTASCAGRAGWTLDGEIVSIKTVVLKQRPRMIRALTGIQMGPRDFEFPPNMPVSLSAGIYATYIPGRLTWTT